MNSLNDAYAVTNKEEKCRITKKHPIDDNIIRWQRPHANILCEWLFWKRPRYMTMQRIVFLVMTF